MIYLDNAGTTKMFDECVEVHKKYSCDDFFNPSALSGKSLNVSREIQNAEEFVLMRLGAKNGGIIWTGCATESNNLAIMGSLRNGDWEYVFSSGEHPSVHNVAKKLQQNGKKVIFVPLKKDGRVDLEKLEEVLCEKTRLISIMHVSNETGAVNDLKKISEIKNKKCPNSILHVDGVQGFMKLPLSLDETAIDLYSFSGHKIHAPKGIAGLYVKKKSSLKSLFEGGGQQDGLRSGTENVSGIMQLKKAVEIIDVEKNYNETQSLRKSFVKALDGSGVDVRDYGGSPYIINLVFPDVKGETMLHALESEGVIVGLGSACSAKKAGNRVLQEIGVSSKDIISSARISFNAYMSQEEVIEAGQIIATTYKNIKFKVN